MFPWNEHLPVFVYGTLRVGGRFHDDVFAGAFTRVEPAELRGAIMWDNHDAYPYVVIDPDGGTVTGELFTVPVEQFGAVMARLDRLEGHVPRREGNLYDRRVVDVEVSGRSTRAWVYVLDESSTSELDADLPRVPSGDWFDRGS